MNVYNKFDNLLWPCLCWNDCLHEQGSCICAFSLRVRLLLSAMLVYLTGEMLVESKLFCAAVTWSVFFETEPNVPLLVWQSFRPFDRSVTTGSAMPCHCILQWLFLYLSNFKHNFFSDKLNVVVALSHRPPKKYCIAVWNRWRLVEISVLLNNVL